MNREQKLEQTLQQLTENMMKDGCMRCGSTNTNGPLCNPCKEYASKLFHQMFKDELSKIDKQKS
jgi:hypothetical protein